MEEPSEDETFTDEVIEDFFEAMEPVAHLTVNQHTLDVLCNMAVVSLLVGSLIAELQSGDRDEALVSIHALHEAFPHSPECYANLEDQLVGLWRELYSEEYIDYLYEKGDEDDSG